MPRSVSADDLSIILGVTRQAVSAKAAKEGWEYQAVACRGGSTKLYQVESLPEELRRRVTGEEVAPVVVSLADEARKRGIARPAENRIMGPAIFEDERAARLAEAVREALDRRPAGIKKRAWIESVAIKYGCSWQHLYKAIKKYEKDGLAGLVHKRRGQSGGSRVWDDEALEYWIGLCTIREGSGKSRKALYLRHLVPEARARGWRIGGERSALKKAEDRVSPPLLAYRDGGLRALDNIMPPILRDYSDLEPFEIIVGDQHKFDFWVWDEVAGKAIRPEGYFWQDMRTRMWYGGAVDRKYNGMLMGLGLRIGLVACGTFGTIYTDNGGPEKSEYIESIVQDMQSLGLKREYTIARSDIEEEDGRDCYRAVKVGHRWAIVRNAKAKPLERSFQELERALRDLGVPGRVKDLRGSEEEAEVHSKELAKLIKEEKLFTLDEFILWVYRAMDYLNKEKESRSLAQEWIFGPRPKSVTPIDVLHACYKHGWKPRFLDEPTINLIFLARADRVVKRGRIILDKKDYEHRDLIPLHNKRVDLRYDPFDPEEILVFFKGKYICTAKMVERGSMKNPKQTERLIRQKRQHRRGYIEEYRKLTKGIGDLQMRSQVTGLERAAIEVEADRKKDAAAKAELVRVRTEAEIIEETKAIETAYVPPRVRPVFRDDEHRMEWLVDQMAEGRELEAEDREWLVKYWGELSPAGREYWITAAGVYGVNLEIKNFEAGRN